MSNKKTKNGQRKSLLVGASVLAAAASLVGAPAYAQDEAEEEEAIVVTGTRLVRQDFEAISPVTTVGSEQLELTATLTTESLLNELPQIIPGNTRTSNNSGGFDYATVDLRGLGPGRTLVLVNGERIPVSSTLGAVDINTIPASLISRIEVVTGGASAVYGSDAMAGVINFVLKDDYEGAEINLTYGSELETGNAAEFEINGLVGGNFANGRGNMTAYASYYDRNKVSQSEYDYSRVSGAICYNAFNGQGTGGSAYYICDSAAESSTAINGPNGIFEGGGGFGDDGGIAAAGGSGTPSWGWITNNPAGIGTDWLWGTADDTGNAFGGAATGGLVGTDGVLGPTAAGPDGILLDNPLTLNVNEAADNNTSDDTAVFNNALALFTQLAGQFAGQNTDCNPATAVGNVRGGNLSFNDAGLLTPRFVNGACNVPDRAAGSSRYNFAPDNYLILPAERIALTTTGHYDITDSVRLNLLINFANSRSEVQLAPTPATGLTVTLTDNMQALIQANAPDLWTALQTRPDPTAPFTIDRRMNEVGTRNGFFENNSFFFLTGLEGSLGENWDWNLSASYGQVMFNTRAINSVNATALRQGLAGCQSVVGTPGGGDDAALGVNALPGCVPLDIFGPGTLDPTMVSFISVNTYNDTIIEENRVTGFVRGDLFELPAGPIASVFGFEYRDTYAESTNDNEQRTGNIFGFNAVQDQRGAIDVYELYTEVAVPILAEMPVAHYLGLELGFRRSNYSSVGNVDTYKIGGEWAPVEWLRFRGVFNEATRAPSVFELFQAGDQGFPAYIDPCRDVNNNGVPEGSTVQGTPPTAAFCEAQSSNAWSPGFTANNSQVEAFAFGNPNLTPETAETSTYGVVFTPDWFPLGDLRASVDYYDIEITDVIAAVGAQFLINQCYHFGIASACGVVVRDPITAQIDFVNTTISNQAALATSGYDFQLEWSVPVGPGQLTVNELYSILDSFTFNGIELAGTTTAAIGGALPDYKSVLSVSYNVGDWTLFGRWSYTPSLTGGTVGEETPEASYVDASVRWNVTDAFTLTAVVDNVFDEAPPQTIDGFFSQANTDPQVYRVLGRSFAVSGRFRF